MEHNFSKGDHVFIKLINGKSYEADIKDFSKTYQRLSLKNIIQRPENVIIDGLRHFEISEISQMTVADPQDSAASVMNGEAISSKDSEEKFLKNLVTRKISDSEFNKITDVQNSCCLIDNITVDFHNAISKLQESKILGLCAKDTSKGRSERASVIVLSTASNIFIFDLDILGDKVFDKGLREVLQSNEFKKVVYDCRLLSDCLFHKHRIKLVNVRDVEAEDIMVVQQERGCIRNHSRPFGYLVEAYLGVSSELFNETHILDSWRKRPLSPECMRFLATYASFLIPLHQAIEKHFLQRLVQASNVYNEYIRDSHISTYIMQDFKFVLRDELNEIVQYKNTCRGRKKKST